MEKEITVVNENDTDVSEEKEEKEVKKKAPKKRVDLRTRAERIRKVRAGSTYTLGLSIRCVLYALLVVAIYVGCNKAYSFGTQIFSEEGMQAEGEDIVITIPAGADTKEIAQILKKNGLIKDELIFMIQTFLYEGKYYSGTFTLNTAFSPEEIVETLSAEAYTP